MAMELILEGQLEKEEDREAFANILKEICENRTIKIEDYDTSLFMDICPEGFIACTFEGVYVSITSQTSVAGPGFHAFVSQVYDDILLKSGISFEVQDSTHYFENRDFESLKYKYFYPWLEQISQYVKDYGSEQKDLCICWSANEYRPMGKEGYVITPLGYRSIEAFAYDIEELAEDFFIWNHIQRDAPYYRNCAYALLWKEGYFAYSMMNDETNKTAHMIIDYVEAAYDADSTIELPMKEYNSICDALQREKLIHVHDAEDDRPLRGYRQQLVSYPIGNWYITVDGFAEKTFDSVTETLNIMAPYTHEDMAWKWLIKAHVYTKEQHSAFLALFEEENACIDMGHETIVGKAILLHEEGYERFITMFTKEEERLIIDCYIRDEKEVGTLMEWCKKCKYQVSENSQTMH